MESTIFDEVFGLCGLHSAAFWPNNYEAYNLITNGPVKDIKWNSIWGTYESLYTNMRDFRDYLNSVNSEIEWLERPEGHSWGLWRANIDRILEYFFPESATNLIPEKNYSVSEFQLYQNYPNPFNPSTIISWQSPVSSHQTLKIYDVLGNELVTLVDEFKPAGMYEVEFDIEQESFPAMASGVYFYRFQAGDFFETRKMIYLK